MGNKRCITKNWPEATWKSKNWVPGMEEVRDTPEKIPVLNGIDPRKITDRIRYIQKKKNRHCDYIIMVEYMYIYKNILYYYALLFDVGGDIPSVLFQYR